MASLYEKVSKANCDVIEYIKGEYDAGNMTKEEAQKQIAATVKGEPKLVGAEEYFGWWCIAVAREIVYTPYGIACSDGVIRLGYKFIGSMIAEETTNRPHQPHDCTGGEHSVKTWPLEQLLSLTESKPSV